MDINSGKKKRQPQVYVYSSLDELLKVGYIYNEKTKYYEKKIKKGSKEIVLRAAEQENVKDKSNNIFYVCNPDVNKEYMHVGFLSKSKNPNDLCEQFIRGSRKNDTSSWGVGGPTCSS